MTCLQKPEELTILINNLRGQGKSITFTNGCFDLLHVGHIRCLHEARSQGDTLIVGLNSDSSVRKIKNEGRPLVPEQERAEMLLALKSVDYVYIYDEVTVHRVLEIIQPDVYVKGRDYRLEVLPEKEAVKKYCGRFVQVGDEKEHSTSELVARIASAQSQSGKSHG